MHEEIAVFYGNLFTSKLPRVSRRAWHTFRRGAEGPIEVSMISDRHFAYVQLFSGGRNGRGGRPTYTHVVSSNQCTMVEKKRTGRWVDIQRLCFLTATLTPQGGCQAALDVILGETTLGVQTLESVILVTGTLVTGTLVMKALVDESLVAGILVMKVLVDESLVAGILVMETVVDESLVAGILVMGPLVDETLDDVTLCFLAATFRQGGHQSASNFVPNAVVARLCSLPAISVHQGEGEACCCRHSLHGESTYSKK